MKKLLLLLTLLPGMGAAYEDDALTRPLEPPLIVDRPEWNNPSPRVVIPVQPSMSGPSYFSDDQIRRPDMECIRVVGTNNWRCQPR